jgi:hypothetical protein
MNIVPVPLQRAYAEVQARLRAAETRYGRPPGSVALLAVSKTQPPEAVAALAALGQRAFGENYVQEALAKSQALADLPLDLEWHFIGPLQANKARQIAENFAWVHSLDREKMVRRLAALRPDRLPPLNCLVEVNVSGEATKSGIPLAALPDFLPLVAAEPRLRLRGLMAMPAPQADLDAQRAAMRPLAEAFRSPALACHGLDTLSLGTSADLEAAVAEGTTLVRIGTALFGPRVPVA